MIPTTEKSIKDFLETMIGNTPIEFEIETIYLSPANYRKLSRECREGTPNWNLATLERKTFMGIRIIIHREIQIGLNFKGE